jgi:dTDP-4-dehydrorhamnose reductase
MRVAVVGAKGQLGAAVVNEFGRFADVLPLDRSALDITDGVAVEATLARLRPEAIVNCTGYNAVDAAEDHPVEAFETNAFAVRALARAARALDAVLVHYGSDFVFDGTVEHAHTEDEAPNPRSVYAMSKMLGEWFAADAPRHYVLRVESLFGDAPGGPPPKGSVAGIVASLRSGGTPNAFCDRTVSPTYVPDGAWATGELLNRRAPYGLYHLVNSGSCTWLEFAHEVARQLGIEPRANPVRVEDVKLKATRPKYCALSNAKLAALGIAMPSWQDALTRSLSDDRRNQ